MYCFLNLIIFSYQEALWLITFTMHQRWVAPAVGGTSGGCTSGGAGGGPAEAIDFRVYQQGPGEIGPRAGFRVFVRRKSNINSIFTFLLRAGLALSP
jgi:hypothetical protein